MSTKLQAYIAAQPRGALRKLARAIGAHEPDVSRWSKGLRPIPFHHAAAIEKATDGWVTRQEMFPDVWHVVWPEIAAKKRKAKTSKKAEA